MKDPGKVSLLQEIQDRDDGESHVSVVEYVWWSLITITTIGYGTPQIETSAGKTRSQAFKHFTTVVPTQVEKNAR